MGNTYSISFSRGNIIYVGAGAVTAQASGVTVTPTLPAGVASGDILVAICANSNTAAWSSGGWTAYHFAGAHGTVLVKRAGVAEADPTFTIVGLATNRAVVTAFRGCRAIGDPVEANSPTTNIASPAVNGGVTSTSGYAMIVYAAGIYDEDTTVPKVSSDAQWSGSPSGAALTEAVKQNGSTGGQYSLALGLWYDIQPTAGATGSSSHAWTNGGDSKGSFSTVLAITRA